MEKDWSSRWNSGFQHLAITTKEMSYIYRKMDKSRKVQSNRQTAAPPARTAPPSIGQLREQHKLLIDTCSEFGLVLSKAFEFPHLVIAINLEGHIIYMSGDDRSLNRAACENIYMGESLAYATSGINPFNIVMELQRPLYIDKGNRFLQSMQAWNCFCYPIHKGKQPEAYIGFLLGDAAPGPGVSPFLQAIAMKLERQYAERIKQQELLTRHSNNVEDRLSRFELTSRERQVAAFWMLDYDYRQISRAIGISENTVRVLVGKINNKMKVNSKASLILKVFDAI